MKLLHCIVINRFENIADGDLCYANYQCSGTSTCFREDPSDFMGFCHDWGNYDGDGVGDECIEGQVNSDGSTTLVCATTTG